MDVHAPLDAFGRLPAFVFPAAGEGVSPPEPETVAWYLSVDPSADADGEGHEDRWRRFLGTVATERVRALALGPWWRPGGNRGLGTVVELLVAARDRFPALRSLCIGDMRREYGSAWLDAADVSPVLTAFPALEEFGMRNFWLHGDCGPACWSRPVRHEALRTLVIDVAGGMPGEAARGIAGSDLPALERLELSLGSGFYGAGWTPGDLAPLLTGERLPNLRHLALRNSDTQDDVAAAIATAPVVDRLTSLDLSMGNLGDTGAQALLDGRSLTHLDRLDLHFHYLTDAMADRVRGALEPHGVAVDLSDRQERRTPGTADFPGAGEEGNPPEPGAGTWRLAVEPRYGGDADGEERFEELWARFLGTVDLSRVRGLVIGQWDDEMFDESSAPVIDLITAARDRLTGLKDVFLGDVTSEECELSWIRQSDVTRLLHAFPGLEHLRVRGETDLAFPPVRHASLRSLTLEAAGLSGAVVRGIAGSDLPALERLELWLGVDYRGSWRSDDLAPILSGERLPNLRHLALRNSDAQDDVAAAIATAPVVDRLTSLDLSMGTLTDTGAQALLTGQPLTHLDRLDLHFHYLTDAMADRVRGALEPHGVAVDLSDRQGQDGGGRFVEVSE